MMPESHLPSSWEECRLGDVVDYGVTQKAEPDEIPADAWVLELEDIEKDTSKVLQRTTFAQRRSKSTKNRFAVGDVLYGKLRPYLNKVVRADQDGYCTTEIVPLRRSESIDGGYLFYWLKHPTFLEYVISVSHGLNMPRLGTEAGKRAPLVLAPINEQKRIVDKLDALLARVDACRERLDRVTAILKRFRQSVLAAATSGKLTEEWRAASQGRTPWTSVRLRELTQLITKGASPKWQGFSYVDSDAMGTLFITSENVREMQLDVTEPKYVESAFNDAQRRSILQRGDLLTNIVGASIGRTAIYDLAIPANINQAVCVVRLKEGISGRFILYSLSSPSVIAHMHSEKVDVARANLSLEDVGNIPLAIPRRDEQDEIVHRVEALFAYANRLEARYSAARDQIDRLTPALLAKAFRGELVPQDPNDEPASVLLERIRAARGATEGAAGPKRRKGGGRPKTPQKTEVLMLTRNDIQDTHLTMILKDRGPLTAEALWSASELDIDDFYDQLKNEEDRGLLQEKRGDSSNAPRMLEAA